MSAYPCRYFMEWWFGTLGYAVVDGKKVKRKEDFSYTLRIPDRKDFVSVSEEEILSSVKPLLEEQGYKHYKKSKYFGYGRSTKNYITTALERDYNYIIKFSDIVKGKDGRYYHKYGLPIDCVDTLKGKLISFLIGMGVLDSVWSKGIRVDIFLCSSCVYYDSENSWMFDVHYNRGGKNIDFKIQEAMSVSGISYMELLHVSRSWNLLNSVYANRDTFSYGDNKYHYDKRDKFISCGSFLFSKIFSAIRGQGIYSGSVVSVCSSGICSVDCVDGRYLEIYLPDVSRVFSDLSGCGNGIKSVRYVIPAGDCCRIKSFVLSYDTLINYHVDLIFNCVVDNNLKEVV